MLCLVKSVKLMFLVQSCILFYFVVTFPSCCRLPHFLPCVFSLHCDCRLRPNCLHLFPLSLPMGVSQSRVKLLQSHYFKHTTSSSVAEVLFQSPVYLEIYRARRTPFGEISRLHMSRLRGLKIPTMLCARTNFPKSPSKRTRD